MAKRYVDNFLDNLSKGESVIGLWFAEWRKKEVERLMEEVKIRNTSRSKEINVNSYGQREVDGVGGAGAGGAEEGVEVDCTIV